MGYEERQKRRQEKSFLEKKKRKKNIIITIAVMFSIAALLAGIRIPRYMAEKAVYVTVGETTITKPQYYYFYNLMVNNFQSEYEDYLSYMSVDFEKDLSNQMLTEDESWEEYFTVNTDMMLYEMLLLYNQAKAEGFNQEAIEESVKNTEEGMELYAAASDLTFEQYIKYSFHEDLSVEKFRECLEIYITSNQYSNSILGEMEISDEEYEEYYNNNKESLDVVKYYQINVKEDNYADSLSKAEDIIAIIEEEKTEDAFVTQAQEYQGSDGYLENTFSNMGTPADWLMSAEDGTYKLIEDSGNNQVLLVYKVGRERNTKNTVNMRHLLLSIPEDVTDETSYYGSIQALQQEYENGDKTEESFAALADKYSEDTASVGNGGLYEDISEGEMDSIIDAWLFMGDRKAGDVTILRSSYGFHLVYFVGEGIEEYKKESHDAIIDGRFDSYMDTLKEQTLYVKKKG